MEHKPSRRDWRKIVKKLQRKKKRQLAARERDKKLLEDEKAKQNDPEYQHWLRQQAELELHQAEAEESLRLAEEEAWLRREVIAQQQFRIDEQRRAAVLAEKEELIRKQTLEFEQREALKKQQREEKQRQQAEALAEFENTMKLMEEYLANDDISEPPKTLRRIVESKPSGKRCEFYERTNCCRFGLNCIYNHRRPLLSCIILVRHFFMHPLLQEAQTNEYASADTQLELSERDLRDAYDAFFHDVLPELEKFGKIINFRTTRNVLAHLRGHVFVEYKEERSALKAFINLQGRYYATKRLNVEFSSLTSWRGAICGLSFTRKCPKANNCNYLHLFRNPDNKYNTMLEQTKPKSNLQNSTYNKSTVQTPLLSWNDVKSASANDTTRNWRWSESPEVELKSMPSNLNHRRKKCTNTDNDGTEIQNDKSSHLSDDRSSPTRNSNDSSCKETKSNSTNEIEVNKNKHVHKKSKSRHKSRKRSCSRSKTNDGEHASKKKKKHKKHSKS